MYSSRESVSVRMVVPFWGECECPHGGGMMYPSGESVSVRMVVV